MDSSDLFRILDVAAIVTNGLLGAVVARTFRFDLVGFILISIISGMGGGMIRDVLLGSGLPVMLTDRAYAAGALAAAAIGYFLTLEGKWTRRALIVVDFLGMGCWTATGFTKAQAMGLALLPSISLGVITAIGGGIIRDVMVNQIPSVLGGSSLYATVAFGGAVATALVVHFTGNVDAGMFASVLLCGVFGVMARRWRWTLPEPMNLKMPRPQFRLRPPRPPRPRLRGWRD